MTVARADKPGEVVVGIDLGTTNSVVAARDEYGRPAVLPNREGERITPSVLYFGTSPPAVGQEAKEWARLGDAEVASFFKPHMGDPNYRLRFGGRDYSATDLSAILLGRLKADAEAALGVSVSRAVVTVPAYFADPQRRATIEAAEAAGLEVLRIINEPTAAALAYGAGRDSTSEQILIYDLGGGTFDVTVAEVGGGALDVLATAGDHDLGGKNWDDRIAAWLGERFLQETGIDPLDDPVALNEVLVRGEGAKWTLSDRSTARIALQVGAERRTYELSRDEFEAMTAPLLDRTRRLTEEALSEAGLDWKRLDGVLLVGGSTRMPMVREYVTKMAGGPPRSGVNVDEVVALGAALQAGAEVGESMAPARPGFTLGSPTAIRDVMSHGLGAVAVSADGSRYVNDVIVPRNRPIPASGSRPYIHGAMGGDNDRLEVYLTQGESDRPLDCAILGRYAFRGIRPTRDEVTVDVDLSYDRNGVVQVRATQRDTGEPLAMSVEPVPDDLSWLDFPPEAPAPTEPRSVRIYLLMDVSSNMAGPPLEEARAAAREFIGRCDFTAAEVGLVSFSDLVTLQASATNNARLLYAALGRLEADGTTNLSDALRTARGRLETRDRDRYVVILTDGYPDAPEDAVREAEMVRGLGIEVVAIGMGDADRDYLRRLASADESAIFAGRGELVRTFGHIARVIAGGRSLRITASTDK